MRRMEPGSGVRHRWWAAGPGCVEPPAASGSPVARAHLPSATFPLGLQSLEAANRDVTAELEARWASVCQLACWCWPRIARLPRSCWGVGRAAESAAHRCMPPLSLHASAPSRTQLQDPARHGCTLLAPVVAACTAHPSIYMSSTTLPRSTQQAVDAHRQRVAAARDAMERAGVAASDARQYVAEREAAAEQAQVQGTGA